MAQTTRPVVVQVSQSTYKVTTLPERQPLQRNHEASDADQPPPPTGDAAAPESFVMKAYGIALVWILLCAILLSVYGTKRYNQYVESSQYTHGTCMCTGSQYGRDRVCPCGPKQSRCTRVTRPCVRVWVNLYRGQGSNRELLNSDVFLYDKMKLTETECTYIGVCLSNSGETPTSLASIYEHWYGTVGKNFTCYYNSHNPARVIRKLEHRSMAILSVILPAVGIVGGVVVLGIMVKAWGCRKGMVVKNPFSFR